MRSSFLILRDTPGGTLKEAPEGDARLPFPGPRRRCLMPGQRVSLIGPHDMRCDGIRAMLRDAPDVVICGDYPDSGAALPALADAQSDVVLIDARARGDAALPRILEIHAQVPAAIIVVVAGDFDPELVLALAEGRFGGYVVWGTMSLETLHRFLRRELDGETLPTSLSATALLVDVLQRPPPLDPKLQSLSVREREVLALVGQGATDQEIASTMTIRIPRSARTSGRSTRSLASKRGLGSSPSPSGTGLRKPHQQTRGCSSSPVVVGHHHN